MLLVPNRQHLQKSYLNGSCAAERAEKQWLLAQCHLWYWKHEAKEGSRTNIKYGSWVPESLEAAIDSNCALPAPWIQAPGAHSPGAGALEEADVGLPGGWHWAANQEKCPFTCQSCTPLVGAGCQTNRKGVSAARLCLACRCLGLSLPDEQCFFTSGGGSLFLSFSDLGSLSY